MLRLVTIFLFLIFSFIATLSAQSGLYLSLETGAGLHSSLTLIDEKVSHSPAFIMDLKGDFRFKIYQNIYFETGLATRFIRARGIMRNNDFKAKTIRIIVPVLLGLKLHEKWNVAAGVNIQNNKDFDKIDLRENFFLRTNVVARGQYVLTEQWFLNLSISHNMQDISDSFFINDPKTILTLGVARKI